jgi:hypothetical protein
MNNLIRKLSAWEATAAALFVANLIYFVWSVR